MSSIAPRKHRKHPELEVNTAPPPASTELPSSPKRKRDDADTSQTGVKKLKSSLTPKRSSFATPDTKRRKSVTFTPDTKTEDGDSIKKLFNAWVAEQQAFERLYAEALEQDPTRSAQPKPAAEPQKQDPPKVEEPQRPEVKEPKRPKEKKGTKVKKSKAPVAPHPPTSTAQVSPGLQYLHTFHHARADWKFNKNLQTWLLKHLYNLHEVPSTSSDSLYTYLAGLQGQVRSRVRAEAVAARTADIDTMEIDSQKDTEYRDALAHHVEQLRARKVPAGYEEGILRRLSSAELRTRLGKRMRADRIVAELTDGEAEADSKSGCQTESTGQSAKMVKLNDGTKSAARRKRKQRTAAADSSSESSSSSESDSDGSTAADESDSSSGSDSDSDSSDSDSSSGSDESSDGESSSDEASSDDDSDAAAGENNEQKKSVSSESDDSSESSDSSDSE